MNVRQMSYLAGPGVVSMCACEAMGAPVVVAGQHQAMDSAAEVDPDFDAELKGQQKVAAAGQRIAVQRTESGNDDKGEIPKPLAKPPAKSKFATDDDALRAMIKTTAADAASVRRERSQAKKETRRANAMDALQRREAFDRAVEAEEEAASRRQQTINDSYQDEWRRTREKLLERPGAMDGGDPSGNTFVRRTVYQQMPLERDYQGELKSAGEAMRDAFKPRAKQKTSDDDVSEIRQRQRHIDPYEEVKNFESAGQRLRGEDSVVARFRAEVKRNRELLERA